MKTSVFGLFSRKRWFSCPKLGLCIRALELDPGPLVRGTVSGSGSAPKNVTDPQHWMQGTKDHFFLDMADDVVRGSIVLNKGVKTWPPNPPIAVAAAAPSKAGLEKTRVFC
jgi:hypothetical protein